MTTATRRLFERVGDAPRQRKGHTPTITIRGSTVRIVCSCGYFLGGGRGCNRAGMDYCIAWAAEKYASHHTKGTR